MKKRIKYLCLMLVCVIIAAGIVGCGIAPNTSNSGTKKTATREYTDMAGRTVTLPLEINKIVAVRYMDLNILAAVLGEDFDKKVISLGGSVEVNDIDNYKKFSESYDLDKLLIMDGLYEDNIDVEAMLELNPDIIIVDTQFQSKGCISKMIEMGLPVVFTDVNTDPFYGELNAMKMLDEMFGKSERVSAMVEYAKVKTDALLARIDTIVQSGTKKPVLYFECGNTIPSEIGQTRGDTSEGWGLLWNKLGADNIGEGHGRDVLDQEIVLTADPDIIVIGGSNWDQTSNIMRMGYYVAPEAAIAHLDEYVASRPGWNVLPAIQNERLYSIHFNGTVYPFNFAVYEYMAKMLWTDEFADIDPQADLEEFFELYMPVKYSGMFAGQWHK
ncbi:ABC transporter substrate-binding protein [Lachnospiraceae bacterium ZAX-1]